jgi:hypothetical protein
MGAMVIPPRDRWLPSLPEPEMKSDKAFLFDTMPRHFPCAHCHAANMLPCNEAPGA